MTSQKNAELGSATSSVKPIDPHTRFIVVGVIVVGSFIALLNQTVMSPALPALMVHILCSAMSHLPISQE